MIAYSGWSKSSASTTIWDGVYEDTDSTASTIIYCTPSWLEDSFLKMLEALESYERSRKWQKAPKVIKPNLEVFSFNILWNRKLSQREWTGRNYHRFGG
jgi:hypothetical protein